MGEVIKIETAMPGHPNITAVLKIVADICSKETTK